MCMRKVHLAVHQINSQLQLILIFMLKIVFYINRLTAYLHGTKLEQYQEHVSRESAWLLDRHLDCVNDIDNFCSDLIICYMTLRPQQFQLPNIDYI